MKSRAFHLLRMLLLAGSGGGGQIVPSGAETLIAAELDGFAIDFLDNSVGVRLSDPLERLSIQMGNEWSGLALDFTTNLYQLNQAVGAETLLGIGPAGIEPAALGLDFTDNTSALRY